MGSVITESNWKSADVDLNFAAAASSFARVVFRSPAANADVALITRPSPKQMKYLAMRIDLVMSSLLAWTPKDARRKPARRKPDMALRCSRVSHRGKPAYVPRVVRGALPVRPDSPRHRISVPVPR